MEIPIRNTYILSENEGDFSCVLYYVSEKVGKLQICRLDTNSGWKGIFLLLEEERIQIPDSETSYLFTEIKVKTRLEKVEFSPQLIPKAIIQTAETKVFDTLLYNTSLTLITLNPEYEYRFFDKNQRRSFIKEFFTERILRAYDTLVPGAFQADLFRYCYLFKNGGCYFDLKIIARKPLRDIIKPNDTFLTCMDYESSNSIDRKTGTSLLNSIIMTTKHNPLLYQMIERCTENILDKQSNFLGVDLRYVLDLTGPTLFYRTVYPKLKQENIRFKHIIKNRDETNYKNFQIVDIDSKELLFTKTCPSAMSRYSDLWRRGEIFYRNRHDLGKYVVYVYPHPYPDFFTFEIEGKKLTIKREAGWGLDLKLKVIGDEETILHVGKNPTKTLVIEHQTHF